MRRDERFRSRFAVGLAVTSGFLCVLTLALPDWVEVVGVDPDRGSGAVEWIIAAALLALALASASTARRLQMRVRRASEEAGA